MSIKEKEISPFRKQKKYVVIDQINFKNIGFYFLLINKTNRIF